MKKFFAELRLAVRQTIQGIQFMRKGKHEHPESTQLRYRAKDSFLVIV
jgi:hypothetical protein